jgi:prepilin-type N-terminal cleavage/methylation domain-containing protein
MYLTDRSVRGSRGRKEARWHALSIATRRRQKAFTLVEVMVATALALLVVLGTTAFTIYMSRSYVALTNYSDLDERGQLAVDKFTQQVRQVKQLTSYSANTNGSITGLTFKDYDDATLLFAYDPSAKTLSRVKGGVTNVFLSGCDSLSFSLYQRTPQPFTFDAVTTAVATNCKLVEVTWVCSRNILRGDKRNTESVQSAKVVLRQQ